MLLGFSLMISFFLMLFEIPLQLEYSYVYHTCADNLAANFSRELADYIIYIIDVSGGDKIPRKGGPGITQADLLVRINNLYHFFSFNIIFIFLILFICHIGNLVFSNCFFVPQYWIGLILWLPGYKQDWSRTGSGRWPGCYGTRCTSNAGWRAFCVRSGLMNICSWVQTIFILIPIILE